jgi:hypothetical protein
MSRSSFTRGRPLFLWRKPIADSSDTCADPAASIEVNCCLCPESDSLTIPQLMAGWECPKGHWNKPQKPFIEPSEF